MYTVRVDKVNMIITFEVSGLIQLDELISISQEVRYTLMQFKQSEVSILVIEEHLDPFPQECLPIVIEIEKLILTHAKKGASVCRRVVTRMQLNRVEESARRCVNGIRIARFASEREALDYLIRG